MILMTGATGFIGRGAQHVMELMWRQAGFLSVQREPPWSTPDAKILHLHPSLARAPSARSGV